MLLSCGEPMMPCGGSFCSLRKSRINRFRDGVDIPRYLQSTSPTGKERVYNLLSIPTPNQLQAVSQPRCSSSPPTKIKQTKTTQREAQDITCNFGTPGRARNLSPENSREERKINEGNRKENSTTTINPAAVAWRTHQRKYLQRGGRR